jgi:hypothetical protein
MTLWPWSRSGRPSEESAHAAQQAARGLLDAQAMHERAAGAADRVVSRVRRNHFAEAVIAAMSRKG